MAKSQMERATAIRTEQCVSFQLFDYIFRLVVMDFLDKHPSVYILIATVVVLLILACCEKCKGGRNLCEMLTSPKHDPTPAIVISNPVFLRPQDAQTIIPGFVTGSYDDDDSESSDDDAVELRNAGRSHLPRLTVASRAGRSIQLPIINSSDSSSSSNTLRSSWNFTRTTKKNKRTGSGSNISLTETADDIIFDSMRSIGPIS